MVSVWLFVIGNFLFFAPIFLSVYCVADLKNRKVHFCLKIFGITIIGGYVTVFLNNICVHISDKKVILISLEKTFKNPKNLFSAKLCSVLSFRAIGVANLNDSVAYTAFLFALQTMASELYAVLKNKKPYLKIKNDLYFKEDFNERVTFFKICAVTNVFTLNLYLSKKILEGLCKTKKTV